MGFVHSNETQVQATALTKESLPSPVKKLIDSIPTRIYPTLLQTKISKVTS